MYAKNTHKTNVFTRERESSFRHRFVKILSVFTFFLISFFLIPNSSVYAFVAPGMTAEGTLTNGTFFGFYPQYSDINGDGYDDMLIGNSQYSSSKGRIYVYFGNGTGFSSSADITITGETNSDSFSGGDLGNSFAVGDINGDGYNDILAGAYGNDEAGSLAGKIYVFYGSATLSGDLAASVADLSALGNLTNNKNFGIGVKILDVNNDNNNDVIVVAGTATSSTSSKIYTFLNTNNTFDYNNPSFTLSTTGTNTFGLDFWTIGTGDSNGDNVDDLLSIDNSQNGKLFLFNGSNLGGFSQTSVFNAETTTDLLGRNRSTSTADINSDGLDDFCAGAYSNDTVATNQGRVYCFFGRSSFDSSYSVTVADIILNGQASNDNFGRTTFLYDVTNDGKPDLLVGAYQNNVASGSRHGKFFIYKNTAGTFADSPWFSEVKTSGNTAYGNSVSAFDWDYDGWPILMCCKVEPLQVELVTQLSTTTKSNMEHQLLV